MPQTCLPASGRANSAHDTDHAFGNGSDSDDGLRVVWKENGCAFPPERDCTFHVGGTYDQGTHSMVLPGGLGRLDCYTTCLQLASPPAHRPDCAGGIACYCPGGWLRHNLSMLAKRVYGTDAVPCGRGCPCPDRNFCSQCPQQHARHRQ